MVKNSFRILFRCDFDTTGPKRLRCSDASVDVGRFSQLYGLHAIN